MRYWIYWNNMVQGPFEVDELKKLHAFSERLLVCLDGTQEWFMTQEEPLLVSHLNEQSPVKNHSNSTLDHNASTPCEQLEFHERNGQITFPWKDLVTNDVALGASDAYSTMPFRFGNALMKASYPVRKPISLEVLPQIPIQPPPLTKENWSEAWPWFAGAMLLVGVALSSFFWWIDQSSSKSAIHEATSTLSTSIERRYDE